MASGLDRARLPWYLVDNAPRARLTPFLSQATTLFPPTLFPISLLFCIHQNDQPPKQSLRACQKPKVQRKAYLSSDLSIHTCILPTYHTPYQFNSTNLIHTMSTPGAISATGASIPLMRGVEYRCGDCGAKNVIKGGDPVRCRQCGFRILYKTRTKRCELLESTVVYSR